jgi:molecular chaperone DnaJ
MPTKRDYYEILGVDRDATDEEIKRAFRQLAFKFHPDHNREEDAGERFKEINEAYQVLCDPDKRAAYDRYGHSGAEGLFGQGFEGFDFGGFGDIFNAFFGGGAAASRQGPQRGADLRYSMTLTFEEATLGCEKKVSINRTENCTMCQGTGSKPGSQPSRCPNCNGSGQVHRVHQSIFGRFSQTATCPQCRGEGRVITDPCPQCRGSGKERHRRKITVTVPAGVDNGSQMRLRGEGEAGTRGGGSGDILIALSVKEHEFFSRYRDDLLYELPVNFVQAALGTEVEVPTLDGNAKLKIPAGSQTGEVFKLRGKGVAHLRGGGHGDLLVTLFVATPDSLSGEQEKLLKELEESLGKKNMPKPKKWRGFSRPEY